MASMDPTDDEVLQVVEVTGLSLDSDRSLIKCALKNNNRNVESVIMGYFDNPDDFRKKYNMTWDDSQFSTDRNGEKDNHTGISFHIESLDQNDIVQTATPPPGQYGSQYGSAAPSRPPSRTNSKNALDRMVDWTAGDAGAAMMTDQPEDEMQRALRESAQEAGVALPAQETGVTGTDAQFGPATRSDYDQGNWAMVPTAASAWEKLDNTPSPSARKRIAGAPAFLIYGSTLSHKLGGLFSILHQIPLARNLLLGIGPAADSYGFNPEWWKGEEINQPYAQASEHAETDEIGWGNVNETKPGFEQEIHRLMAFLDSTERSYGSVGTLYGSMASASFGAEKCFYQTLDERHGDKLEALYQTASLALCSGEETEEETATFGMLELEHVRGDYNTIKTLYEALDHLMWSDVLTRGEMHTESKMAMFKHMGDVIAINIGGDGPEESIEIPLELYPEKYQTNRKAEACRIQAAWGETKRAMTIVAAQGQTLNEWRDDWGERVYTKRETMQQAKDQWTAYSKYLESAGRFKAMQGAGFDTSVYPDYRLAPSQLAEEDQLRQKTSEQVVELTNNVISEMDEKLQSLADQMEQLQAKQRFLGRLLTSPDKPGRPKPMTCKKYLLRGIATENDVIYICQRQQSDLIELSDEAKPLDQWWKMSYSQTDTEPVKVDKIDADLMLREVWQITKTPLLVYATEEAVETAPVPLTGPLDRFVLADNKAFRQELNNETNQTSERRPSAHAFMDPISPSKRKHRSDSADSMDSNRASIGSNEGLNSFHEQQQSQTEMPLYSYASAAAAAAAATTRPVPVPEPDVPALPPRPAEIAYPTTQWSDIAKRNTSHSSGFASAMPQPSAGEAKKSPEMQERQRPPSLVQPSSGGGAGTNSMDMEMPKEFDDQVNRG